MVNGLLDLHVWIDRARVLKRDVVAIEEGEPVVAETFGDWFACRLPPKAARQSWGERHRTLDDRREMSAMVTVASDVLTESDRLEIEVDGVAQVWEVEQCFRPRDGAGNVLLLVCNVIRREET